MKTKNPLSSPAKHSALVRKVEGLEALKEQARGLRKTNLQNMRLRARTLNEVRDILIRVLTCNLTLQGVADSDINFQLELSYASYDPRGDQYPGFLHGRVLTPWAALSKKYGISPESLFEEVGVTHASSGRGDDVVQFQFDIEPDEKDSPLTLVAFKAVVEQQKTLERALVSMQHAEEAARTQLARANPQSKEGDVLRRFDELRKEVADLQRQLDERTAELNQARLPALAVSQKFLSTDTPAIKATREQVNELREALGLEPCA